MRHNPASGALVIMLRSLKMFGMAQAVGELTEQGSPAFEAAMPILSQLLKAETAEREVRSTAYQLKAARFPAYRDLNGFEFASSEVNEALVRQLHRCEFIEDAHNVVLVGGPGTGKTHIATALGIQASGSATWHDGANARASLDQGLRKSCDGAMARTERSHNADRHHRGPWMQRGLHSRKRQRQSDRRSHHLQWQLFGRLDLTPND